MRERIVRVWFRAEACLFSVVLKGRAGGCAIGAAVGRDLAVFGFNLAGNF